MTPEPAPEAARFRRVGEVEVDGRRRVSLGKVGNSEHTRYFVSENDDGEILLTPAVSIPESLVRGMEQATAGQLVDQGSFAQYATEND